MEKSGRAAGVLSTREATGRGGRRARPILNLQGPSSLRRLYCRIFHTTVSTRTLSTLCLLLPHSIASEIVPSVNETIKINSFYKQEIVIAYLFRLYSFFSVMAARKGTG